MNTKRQGTYADERGTAGSQSFDVEAFIRESAERGMSKNQVRETLGLCRETFYAMLEAMPPLNWPPRGKSLGRKLSDEARRGYCPPALHAALRRNHAAKTEKGTYTVNGQRGTIEELVRHYSVSASTVRRRMKAGMTLEQALATPPTARPARYKGFNRGFAA